MKTFVVSMGLLILAVSVATDSEPDHNYGRPGDGNYYQLYSQRELAQADDFLNKIDEAKAQLMNKVRMLKNQKQNLLGNLNQFQGTKLNALDIRQNTQDGSLDELEMKIKEVLHNITDEVAALDGEAAIAREQEAQIQPRWDLIEALASNNRLQDGLLDKSRTFLKDAKEKLTETLDARKAAADGSIDELAENTQAEGRLVSSRICQSRSVEVQIDSNSAEGLVASDNGNAFNGYVPTVYCALEGFVSRLDLDKSHGYGYGSYDDLSQNLALSVDCKAFADRTEVKAIDLSKGQGNSISVVYVQVKECTLGPQSS